VSLLLYLPDTRRGNIDYILIKEALHDCNLSYEGRQRLEDLSLRSALDKNGRLYLKNNEI
jgi:hypothetical protein